MLDAHQMGVGAEVIVLWDRARGGGRLYPTAGVGLREDLEGLQEVR
jgi:hypothetical protein